MRAPIALKVQSPEIPHKSDVGALALNLSDAESIRRGYSKIMSSAKHMVPHANIHGVLVQRNGVAGH